MELKRKLQLGAGAVILNCVMALSAVSPQTALASACQPKIVYGCGSLAACQVYADPGCTAVSTECITFGCGCQAYCTYQ